MKKNFLTKQTRSALVTFCLFQCCLYFLTSTALAAQPKEERESRIKAAIFYYLTNYISWPENVFSSPSSPIRLCFFGKDPINDFVSEILANKSTHGRPIEVEFLEGQSSVEKIASCHLAHFGGEKQKDFLTFISKLGNLPVLTVASSADITEYGGMIYLYTEENRVKIKIDNEKTLSVGLKISSELLNIATLRKHQED